MGRKKSHLPRGTVIHYECEDIKPKTEVSAVFSSSTGVLTLSYSQAEARDTCQPPPVRSVTNEVTPPAKEPAKARKQGASIIMEQFSKYFDSLQAAVLSTKVDDRVGLPCQCQRDVALFRCMDCSFSPILCSVCAVASHTSNPFHRLEKWTGSYFRRTTLCDLGHIIGLGHYGVLCPTRLPDSNSRPTTIVHVNGIHHVRIQYCQCADAPSELEQLAKSSLFPASIERPETAFTFNVLKEFHVLSSTSKIAAYDFFNALADMTNSTFPNDVTDRYREFLRVERIWRHLATLRRSGQTHGIDNILSHRQPNSVTVHCPACPEPGFNVDNADIQSASEDETHKYTLFLSVDGNFRLQRKNKRDDPDDIALNKGNGYFAESEKFKEYLWHVKPMDDLGTCAHLRAARMQNIVKFKNAVVSGVVGVQCARHGFYMPRSTVDLTKGEAFANTDYALAETLKEATNQRWIMVSYDIWCQYSKNLRKRFNHSFPTQVELLGRIRGAIPKMHIKNHIEACQQLYAFNYLKFSGETWGENIEGSWAEQNQTAGSTKEQNDGHRHDTLDDFFGFWNWSKLCQLPKSLLKSYKKCVETLVAREAAFKVLTSIQPPELIALWKSMDDAPKIVNGKVHSVYEAQFQAVPPTQLRAYQSLLEAERCSAIPSGDQSTIGNAQLVNIAIDIEDDQYRVQHLASLNEDAESLTEARARLQKKILNWKCSFHARFPHLDHNATTSPIQPEQEILMLPSFLNKQADPPHDIEVLVDIELALRKGQAHDALNKLRTSIRIWNYNFEFKKNEVRGQKQNTRAQRFLKTLHEDIKSAAATYRRARAALVHLGIPEDNVVFRPLLDSELYLKNTSKPAKLGDNRKEDPWFWYVGQLGNESSSQSSSWAIEMDRVKWFRDRAAYHRSQEEKEILESEFSRTLRSFCRMADTWRELAKQDAPAGYCSYAYQQASMYDALSSQCRELYVKVLAIRERYFDEKPDPKCLVRG